MTLSDRVSGLSGLTSNTLDVEIEIAMFEPNAFDSGIRANSAGTKVIFQHVEGGETTCWADDWTLPCRVQDTIRELKARGL